MRLAVLAVILVLLAGCGSGQRGQSVQEQAQVFKDHKAATPPPPGAMKPQGQAYIGKPSGPLGMPKGSSQGMPPAAAAARQKAGG